MNKPLSPTATFPPNVHSILLLPFEDQKLHGQIQQLFPHATITVLRKHDLAGLSPFQLLRTLRKERYDLAVVSLHAGVVHRSLSSVYFLFMFVRARNRMIKLEDGGMWGWEPRSFLFNILPRLLAGTFIGIGIAVYTYGYLFLSSRTQKTVRPATQTTAGTRPLVLFLRTDLAGFVRAGGSISHVKGMIQAFVRAGYRVIYVADARLDILPSSVKQVPLKPISLLDFFDEFQLLAYNLQCLHHVKRLIQDAKPSFVYQRLSLFNFAGALQSRRLGIPCVLEANDSEVWIKKNWSRLVLESLAVRCEARALHLADVIAVISKGVREQLASYGSDEAKFLLNPNGVDPNEFRPDIDGAPIRQRYGLDDNIVVGFIGTFTRWHGIETLFQAAVQVIQHDRSVRFLFVGDGDLRTALEHQAETRGLKEFLVFTGLIPHTEAPRYLAACDILISPHLGFQDGTKFFGSPTKLFEYMAMGKAIIASRLEQIAEVIRDGQNGLLMNPGDDKQLADLILQLASDRALRLRLGQQARENVVANYTWDQNVRRILQLLRLPCS